MLPAPGALDAATSPAETGAAHNPPPKMWCSYRTHCLYQRDRCYGEQGGSAEYPAGTIIVKEIMDKTETFVDKVAVMMKSDDMM